MALQHSELSVPRLPELGVPVPRPEQVQNHSSAIFCPSLIFVGYLQSGLERAILLNTFNMSSRIADGFTVDATTLAKEFAKEKKFDLHVFWDVWKKQKFSMIFLGHRNFKELLEFTNLIFRTAMELFVKETEDTYEHVGYLYAMFFLFKKQPIKPPVKIRITLDNWGELVKTRDKAEADQSKHTLFVIRFLIRNGFDYVAEPTLMGPNLNLTATEVDLSADPPEDLDKTVEAACNLQADVEICFQELKLAKQRAEECFRRVLPDQNPYSLGHNIPYSAFLDALDPYPPPEEEEDVQEEDKEEDPIGNRRALLKAAAYSKTISKAQKSVKTRGKTGKAGRPRKQQPVVEKEEEPERTMPKEPPRKRGQRRERMFKKKYMFQYEEKKSTDPPSPQPGCSKESK